MFMVTNMKFKENFRVGILFSHFQWDKSLVGLASCLRDYSWVNLYSVGQKLDRFTDERSHPTFDPSCYNYCLLHVTSAFKPASVRFEVSHVRRAASGAGLRPLVHMRRRRSRLRRRLQAASRLLGGDTHKPASSRLHIAYSRDTSHCFWHGS